MFEIFILKITISDIVSENIQNGNLITNYSIASLASNHLHFDLAHA